MIYTTIIHPVRIELDITPYEYMLTDIIFRSQGHPMYSVGGWCTLDFLTIANFIGVSKRTANNASKRLKGLGILEMKGQKKRVTKVWCEAFQKVQKLHPKSAEFALFDQGGENIESAKVAPQKVQKLHSKSAKVAYIKRNKNKLKINNTSSPIVEEKKEEDLNNLKIDFPENTVTDLDAEKKKKIPPKKKKGFEEIEWGSDAELFRNKFLGIAPGADFEFYRKKILNWSKQKTAKLIEDSWVSTVNRFINSDISKGQLVKKENHFKNDDRVEQEGMPEYNTKIF